MIKVENLHKSYGDLEVLRGIDLTIAAGELVAIVGASGAGKSTLLHIIGSLSLPDRGCVTIDGVRIDVMNDKALSEFRNRKIGFVFQFHHLLPEFTVLENVSIPGYIAGGEREEVEQHARELIASMGLSHRIAHKPAELSGGEQQRVAIARALINRPVVLLADEPSGNLDSENRAEIHKLFFDLRDKMGQTVVIVTHDRDFAATADRSITMKDGIVVA